MKIQILTFATLLVSALTLQAQTTLSIPAKQVVHLDYPQYDLYAVTIQNTSKDQIEVNVIDKVSYASYKGFGLRNKSKATVTVEKNGIIQFTNNNNKAISLKLKIEEQSPADANIADKAIRFTLSNKSAQSIPLIIPTVMNPNLSPFSSSGVDLAVGQEVFFKQAGKKYLLLRVDDSIKDGDDLDVSKLLKAKKKELGLK